MATLSLAIDTDPQGVGPPGQGQSLMTGLRLDKGPSEPELRVGAEGAQRWGDQRADPRGGWSTTEPSPRC